MPVAQSESQLNLNLTNVSGQKSVRVTRKEASFFVKCPRTKNLQTQTENNQDPVLNGRRRGRQGPLMSAGLSPLIRDVTRSALSPSPPRLNVILRRDPFSLLSLPRAPASDPPRRPRGVASITRVERIRPCKKEGPTPDESYTNHHLRA